MYSFYDYMQAGGMPQMKKGGTSLPRFQKQGQVSAADSLNSASKRVINFEVTGGGPGGSPLPGYQGQENKFIQITDKIPEYGSAAVKSQIADWLFRAGWDWSNMTPTINPKAYIVGEHIRKNKKYDKNDWDENWGWTGRSKMSPSEIDKIYNQEVKALPDNEQQILTNLAKDWFFKNRYKSAAELYGRNPDGSYIRDEYGAISPNYKSTWAPGIINMYSNNLMQPFDKSNIQLTDADKVDYNEYYRKQTMPKPKQEYGGYADLEEAKNGGSTFSGNAWYEDGGELALAQFGLSSPSFFNNLSKFINSNGDEPQQLTGAQSSNPYAWQSFSQQAGVTRPTQNTVTDPNQPPAIKYNPKKEAYNMNMVGNGMMSVGQPAGTQLTGATSSNPFAWQSYSQTAAPVNPNQPKQFEQQQADNPIYGDVANLQKTLRDGSGKEIRSSVKDFNQTYGSNMKVPLGTFGSKGRENMEKVGNVSTGIQNVIGAGSVVTDFFNNAKIKKENQQRRVMSGMTDSLNMVAPEDRGDWVAAGSRIGELRPDQYVVNKGMYTGQFYPTMNMMQNGGVIDSEIDMPMGVIDMGMPELPGKSEEPEASPAPKSSRSSGANPLAYDTWDEVSSQFQGVKNLGIWGDKRHQKLKSDHNTGDALDIGIMGKDQGNQIAQKLLKEAKEKNIKYVIWNEQIWNPSVNKWLPYKGDDPHTTHVHVSFNRNSSDSKSNSEDLGQISLTHNNPLNIHQGDFASQYGGKKGSRDGSGNVSIFPDMNTGIKAAKDLLFGPNYNNLTISQARNKWVKGDPNEASSSTPYIVKEMGGDKKLSQLTPAEKDALIKQFAKWEGKQAYTKIKDMKLFEDGGSLQYNEGDVYDLTEEEIRSILSSGGNVEFV